MAHSLEIRTPFVDAWFLRDLAPLIVDASPLAKTELPALLNPAVRAAIEGQPKRGFVVPVREWLGARSGDGHTRGWRAWALDVMAAFRRARPVARAA